MGSSEGAISRIDQLVPGFAPYDAIGAHVLELRRLLRREGFQSDIFGEVIDSRLHAEARPYQEAPLVEDGRILLYQMSTHSEMAGWLRRAAGGGQEVWADYHNITPARYFARWEPDASTSMMAARRELAELAPVATRSMADSRYNEEELVAAGYRSTATAPLLVDLERYHQAPDPTTYDRLRRRHDGGGATWLFVGRIAPNKCQHDIIGAFALYRKLYDPAARLTLVGGVTSPRYLEAMQALASELGVGEAVEHIDSLALPELLAHFATADVFVCLSEHEGFCVPVLEAFELGVPVVAFASSAIPETVGDAGLLVDTKDPLDVAEVVAGLLRDDTRRQNLVDAGRARASQWSLPLSSQRMISTVTGWLDGRYHLPAP